MHIFISVFVLIGAGRILYHFSFPSNTFWVSATQITYFIFLPALLVSKVAAVRFSGSETLMISVIICTSVALLSAVVIGTNRWTGFSGPVLTSVLQGGIRTNTYVGLALASALWGNNGLALAGLVHAIWVLTVNVICVGALVVYCRENSSADMRLAGPRAVLAHAAVTAVQNPLILACGLGILINWSGWVLPIWIMDLLAILGQAALPLGLLLVGAGLRFESITCIGRPVFVSSFAKLLLLPATVWILTSISPVEPDTAAVLLLVACLPASASSYVLAAKLGGDAALMAVILTVETVLAAATMPLILSWLIT